jgi:NTE family protein
MDEKNYDTLVISGGGIKGFILLGAIQAVLDSGKLNNVDTYLGTSMGAILGYLLAIGYTPIEIVVELHTTMNKYLLKTQNFDLTNMINGNGAITFTHLNEGLEKLTLNKIGKFITLGKLREEYGKTLICATYNMTVCTTEYLGPDNYPDLPCLTAIRMSSNIPMIFDRFKYMDNYYIDGGLTDNFPILKGCEIGNKVLGICLEIEENTLKDIPEDGVVSYLFKLLQVPVIQGTRNQINQVKNLAQDKCTIINIMSELRNFLQFDVQSKVKLEMFSKGYETVKKNFNQ